MSRYSGRSHVNPSRRGALGICDRCGFMYSLADLQFQREWYGNELRKLNLRVCPRCMDKPAEFRRAIRLPADPVPVQNPRPMSPAQPSRNRWDQGMRWDTNIQWDS